MQAKLKMLVGALGAMLVTAAYATCWHSATAQYCARIGDSAVYAFPCSGGPYPTTIVTCADDTSAWITDWPRPVQPGEAGHQGHYNTCHAYWTGYDCYNTPQGVADITMYWANDAGTACP